jgi:hypothetical protein
MRTASTILPALACAVALVTFAPTEAQARRWEVRKEVREGAREVGREQREAMRELRRCNTRECARREIREGQREVSRERREARREIRGEVRENYYDNYYRGSNRWYRDGRYWDRGDYERRYYYRRDNDGSDILKGALVGAAVVGVVAAIADANDKDD